MGKRTNLIIVCIQECGKNFLLKRGLTSLYLAFILNVYSRMFVGWQIVTLIRAELVLDKLEMTNALCQRRFCVQTHGNAPRRRADEGERSGVVMLLAARNPTKHWQPCQIRLRRFRRSA